MRRLFYQAEVVLQQEVVHYAQHDGHPRRRHIEVAELDMGRGPTAGVRSVSEVLMHIASEHYVYLPTAVGATPPADLNMGAGREIFANLDKVTAKANVIRHLKAAFAYQKSVLEGPTRC